MEAARATLFHRAGAGAGAAEAEKVWESLFSKPSDWWDFRRSKTNPLHPDFRHKLSREPLWLDNHNKPTWVDSDLSQILQSVCPAPSACSISEEIFTLSRHGYLDKALSLLPLMDQLYFVPTQGMYMSLLKACIKKRALTHAKHIHSHILSHLDVVRISAFLTDFLVVTLAKCGGLDEAWELLGSLPKGSVFSWTAIISACVDFAKDREALETYELMVQDGVEPDACTFLSLFKACANLLDLDQGKRLHTEAQQKGFTSNLFVASTLVSMYGKCGDIGLAEIVFKDMEVRDVAAWSGMLAAYINDGQGERCLQLFRQMTEEGVDRYRLPFVSAVQACGILAEDEKANAVRKNTSSNVAPIEIVRALHADARRDGITTDVFIGSTLLNFYGKLGAIKEAEIACSEVSECDVVAWTAMISVYAEQGQGEKALQLYRYMCLQGVCPNKLTFVFALKACGVLADKEEAVLTEEECSIKSVSLQIGCAVHIDARRKGLESDVLVGSMLVSMYGKCGAVIEAEDAFKNLCERDVVSWTAMLSAYVKEGLGDKALQFYKDMQKQHIALTDIALVSVLQACRGLGCLEIVRQLHFSTVSSWQDTSRLFANTLVHAYGTCASMNEAQSVFDGLFEPDVVAWSACIAGYSQEGNCALCLRTFSRMLFAGIAPDRVAFLSLLSAFRHSGLVREALDIFGSMSRLHCLTPALKHYAIMIDLLGRAGNLKGVKMMLSGMPKQADMNILLGLLGACRTHGNLEMGKLVFRDALHLQPLDATAYVLMSNLYAHTGLQEGE